MSMRILFVEHDVEVRREYHRYCERFGFVSFGAEDAAQCVERIEEFQPNVVVLEPEFMSEDDLSVIASCLFGRAIPVVVVTRLRAIPHIESALSVAAFFVKPVSMKQLVATLEDVVASSQEVVHCV